MMAGFAIGWRQVAACGFLLAPVAFVASGYSVLAVPLGEEFGTSRMVLMLAMTVLAGVGGVLSPFLGNLMDRVSLRVMMVTGALLLGTGYVALSFVTSFTQVLLVFALLITPASVLIGPLAATVLLARWFVKRRGAAIGVAMMGISLGSVVYPPIAQWLLDHYHWREAFRLLALALLATIVPAALMVVGSPAERGLEPDGAKTDDAVSQARSEGPQISVMAILLDPAFWLAAAISSIVLSGMTGMITNLMPVALDQGIKASDAAFLISIYGVCGFLSKLTFAALADRIGTRLLIWISIAGYVAGMGCLTQAAYGYSMIALGVSLTGLFGGLMMALPSFMMPRMFGQRVVGRAMGLLGPARLVASLATPPLFGWVFDVTGSYTAIFLVFSLLGLFAMVALVPFIRLHLPTEPASR
jgi:MFS family permease